MSNHCLHSDPANDAGPVRQNVIRNKKMKLRIFINCVIISAIFSLITPAFFLVEYIPKENAAVPQLNEIDLNALKKDDKSLSAKSIKMRKVRGFERITYMIEQPYFLINYLKNSRWVFLPYLLATLIISFWNIRTYKKQKMSV